MDTHETFKVAKTIKERGNDSFKRGQLSEAQRDYTEVLAMLTEEITFTGDDQRKEKETLVLTAHLNLAQCALRLGDSARVIYHCNTALGMDSNNVKAHFRKARAFENRAEFAEALEGYRHVLTLEPDNETVQRQLSECQNMLDCQKARKQISNKMTRGEHQEIEDEDVEKVYKDSDRDAQTRYKNCSKNPGHKNFRNLKDFRIEHLPPDYRDPELFDCVKHQSQMTVLLKIWPAKKFRQGRGPRTGRNNSGNPGPGGRVRPKRHGSGWITAVRLHIEDDQPCPCHTCKQSESPEKKWAYININTAGHVVCNEREANNTECYFFYDTEEVDVNSCPKLSRAVIQERFDEFDTCFLRFFSHDVGFSQQLLKMSDCHRKSQFDIRLKYNNPAFFLPGSSLLERCEQLEQRCTDVVTEHGRLVEQVVAIFNGDPHTELAKHRNQRKDTIKEDLLGLLLRNTIRGGVRYQRWIGSLQDHYKSCCEFITRGLRSLKQRPIVESDCLDVVSLCQHYVKGEEKRVTWLKHLLGENVTISAREFNGDHRLTIIVSHPHGCSKKITIGETTERTSEPLALMCELTYTTPTCPGSSGAPVFVLGLDSIFEGIPHSAQKSGCYREHLNLSATSFS